MKYVVFPTLAPECTQVIVSIVLACHQYYIELAISGTNYKLCLNTQRFYH